MAQKGQKHCSLSSGKTVALSRNSKLSLQDLQERYPRAGPGLLVALAPGIGKTAPRQLINNVRK